MQNLKIKMDNEMKQIDEMRKSFERWIVIEDYDRYSVSSFGCVRNDATGRILKGQLDTPAGYYQVWLWKNGEKKNMLIRRLVANAFIDNPTGKRCVDHSDNNIKNNNLTNLRYATHKENMQNASMNKNNTSGVKGVSFDKDKKKWRACITIDRIQIHIGYFFNLEDAKKARIDRANLAFGVYKNKCEN